MRASSKSVRSRVVRKFYSMLYFCGCSKHVHETDCKETYTAYVDNNVDNGSFKRVPEVDYSDKPTISNGSSVDIELTELPKKFTGNGSDSAISVQNSSNDSGRTIESYTSAAPTSNKRLKNKNSFDKQRSFDSYTIAECDGQETEDGNNIIQFVQLEHVPTNSEIYSPKSALSNDSKTNFFSFGGESEINDTEDDCQQCLFLDSGSGLFSVHHTDSDQESRRPSVHKSESDLSLVSEMNNLSKLLFSKHYNSEDSDSKDYNDEVIQEEKPLLGKKPKLQRQTKISGSDESQNKQRLLGNLDETDEGRISEINLNDLDINENESEARNKKGNRSKSEGQSDNFGGNDVSALSLEGRTDSYDTFKDLISHKCINGRKKNKLSKNTTV